ncbi:hypothetical protein NUW58_g168 [Xylaria curta]|uniref:Uncharacterized protein n=1 Tax=Xylaria curta TaxID=42375 RepID=A0ACC1PRE0_9PEZI|nr:hypothetical protein NUW58_g168 [Xylaria curta]
MNDTTVTGVRTSGSNPSLRPISNRTESSRSAASHLAGFRHALLKSNSQRQQSIDRDLPVPPVLTQSHPISKDEDGTKNSISRGRKSPAPAPTEPPVHHTEPVVQGPAATDFREVVGKEATSSIDGHDHFHTWRLPISKVRPAIYDNGEYGRLDDQDENPSASPSPPGEAYAVENHFQHNHVNTPKVRPFTEPSFGQVPHPDEQNEKQEPIAPSSINQSHARDVESRKGASYWGFLPRFREKQNDQSPVRDQRGDTPVSRGGSTYPSKVGSRRSLTSVPPTNLGLGPKQENPHQGDEAENRDTATSNFLGEGRNSPSTSGNCSEVSIASLSPTTLPAPASASGQKGQELPPPQKLDTRRAARWIRGLLGFSEADVSPTLTKLPDKTPPRREARGSVASGMTTYSNENTTKREVMDTAMHSLEHLMAEALSLVNEAGEREYGHVDDGHLPLKPSSEDYTHTPSIHESLRRSSSEYGRVICAAPLSNAIGTAVEDLGGGNKASRLKLAERPGLIKSMKRGGKITRPFFLNRMRKNTSSTEIRRHAIDDDCVLPMPLLDRHIKRQSVDRGQRAYDEDDPTGVANSRPGEVPNSKEVREYIRIFHQPPICTRGSSKHPSEAKGLSCDDTDFGQSHRLSEIRCLDMSACSLDGGTSEEAVDFSTQYAPNEKRYPGIANLQGVPWQVKSESPRRRRAVPSKHAHELKNVSLRNRSHVSIGEGQRFSLTKSARRQPTIARDWSPGRKRFVAAVACTSTALIGVLVGLYAGLVPSIQYYIADFHHYTILGNVGLYLGMALPNLLCWPLPLLHGRKPYIVGGLCIAMPLLFPQAIAIGTPRSPNTSVWRVTLLLSRALMGFALGFASMNFHSILTDLFGASLMSDNPHQEVVDEYDVRRHGGGLGVWLGIWTWCFIGSLSVGFLIGAVVIEYLQPSWGLYISIIIIAVVLLLNVLCPEVRRSAWRRSVTEVQTGETISRRLARGEVMMHRVHTGPKWWGQEVYHGFALSLQMLRQPGFTIMAVYSAWIYAQVVLVIVLLGSLTSKSYRFRSPYVGAVVSSVAIGAFAAIPFQKANLFSRARHRNPVSNLMTFDKKIIRSSRVVRRSIFTLVLPIAAIIYTVVSTGPPVHVFLPSFFSAMIGFLSCLAISECNGMLMEAWDCSDLQPGMTGRSKSSKDSHKRTNYSSFPRVTAGWNFIQSLGFIFAAGATGLGGSVTRQLGQREATGVVAAILFALTLLLLGALIRFKRVQIIPDCTCSEMDQWKKERRISVHNWAAAMAAAKENGTKELNNIPEDDLGALTRWSEIRKKNSLIDENAHLNREAVALARDEIQHSARHSADIIMHKISNRSLPSKCSHESSDDDLLENQKEETRSASSPASPSASPAPAVLESRYTRSQREPTPERGDTAGRDFAGFEAQPVRGQSSSINKSTVIPDGVSQKEPSSQIAKDSNLKKHEVPGGGLTHVGHAESAHSHESKVKATDPEFEDVNLGDVEKTTSS